jgi:hypothetical protein
MAPQSGPFFFVLQFVYYQFTPIITPKVTLTNADGSTQDFFPQSYTDAAGAAASVPPVAVDATEVDLLLSDGSPR